MRYYSISPIRDPACQRPEQNRLALPHSALCHLLEFGKLPQGGSLLVGCQTIKVLKDVSFISQEPMQRIERGTLDLGGRKAGRTDRALVA